MKILNKLAKCKQWIIRSVSVRLCFHKYTQFKVGRFPLVASYCHKCGKVKFGNCIYYDGTIYQKVYRGDEAINFVREFAKNLESRNKMMSDFETQFGQNLWDYKEEIYRDEHETIDGYNEIVRVLKNAR